MLAHQPVLFFAYRAELEHVAENGHATPPLWDASRSRTAIIDSGEAL